MVGHLRRICPTCQMPCLPQICPSSRKCSKYVRKTLQHARSVVMVPMWHPDIAQFLNQYQICQCVASVASVFPVLTVFGLRLKSSKLCQCLRLRFAFHWFYVQEAMNSEVFWWDQVVSAACPTISSVSFFSERDLEGSIKALHISEYTLSWFAFHHASCPSMSSQKKNRECRLSLCIAAIAAIVDARPQIRWGF